MRPYRLSDQFVRDFRALEPELSAADAEALDRLLATVIADPETARRFPSFYDPVRPSWLVRGDPFMIHFALDTRTDEVVFLNVFRQR